MSIRAGSGPGTNARFGAARLIANAVIFGVLWAAFADGEGWIIGMPVVLIATAVRCLTSPAQRWSLKGLVRFVPYFLWNSLRGAIDVAARALNPRMPIDPAIIRYELSTESIAARVLVADAVTLLPGTLSVDLLDNVLLVHVLNASGPCIDTLTTVERRVAEIYDSNGPAGSP